MHCTVTRLIPLLFALLAACSQTSNPINDASREVAPLAFGNPSSAEMATGLAKHRTGVYAVGSTTGTLDGPSTGWTDGIIRKYSASGTKLWARQFGTSRDDLPSAAASDANDNAYVVGQVATEEEGALVNADAFIRKYSPSGNLLWGRKFGPSTSEDTATSVAVSGSHIYMVGDTDGSLAGSKGSVDAFIRKYSANGSVVWTRQFGTADYDTANDVAVDASGNAYVVGRIFEEGSAYGSDMYIRKYSPTGNLVWTRQQRGLSYDTGDAVTVFGSHVYLVGMSQEPYAVHTFKYTTSGTLVWSRVRRPYYEDVRDASTDPDGNLYIVGRVRIATTDDDDGYVRKVSPSGSTLWTRRMTSPTGDYTYAVLAPTSDKVYAAGFTYGTLDGSTGRNADAFLRRLSVGNGSTVWTDQ